MLALQLFEVDYLYGQMEQGSGSGVAKVTRASIKHKIAMGSWKRYEETREPLHLLEPLS